MVLSLFHGSTWSDPLFQEHCVYFATLIGSIHLVGSLWLIRENLKGTVFIWGKLLWPFSYNFELVAVIFVSSHRFCHGHCTKMKFSIKDFFSKCDRIRSFLRIWSHLLKKSLMKIFIFCAVGERVKLTNSILLIRLYTDSQYLLWRCLQYIIRE